MHRFLGEPRYEGDREEVKVSVDEAFYAEFGGSVFPGLVLDHFLPDAGESGMFGQNGNIAVHLAVHLDAFDHAFAVGFKSAVEIMKLYARSQARRAVEKFGRQGFGEGIEPLLFPPRDHVVLLFPDHPDQVGNLVGTVLQVGIHGDDDLALCGLKSAVEGGGLAVIPPEFNAPDGWILFVQPADDLPGGVVASVIDQDDFVGVVFPVHDTLDPADQFRQRFLFIEEWNDDGNIHRDVVF